MAELDIRVVSHVDIQPVPVPLLVANTLTSGADRQQTFEGFDIFEASHRMIICGRNGSTVCIQR